MSKTKNLVTLIVAVASVFGAASYVVASPVPGDRSILTPHINKTSQKQEPILFDSKLPNCLLNHSHPLSAPTGPYADIPTTCINTNAPTTLGAVLDGKPTLLNFWAYWCEPCRQELPIIEKFSKQTSMRVVLVHEDSNNAEGIKYLEKLGINLPTITDPKGIIAAKLGLGPGIPQSVIIKSNGTKGTIIAQPAGSVAFLNDVVSKQTNP